MTAPASRRLDDRYRKATLMFRLALAVSAFALLIAACTPQQVTDTFAEAGVDLDPDSAALIAEWVTRDCLPGYDSPVEVECAISDSWHAYPMPVSLDKWAAIAWCESRHDPSAANRYSSARGLFQNLARYWPDRAAAAGFPGGDIFDARTHAFVAAHLASTSGIGHWQQCL